ncbi:phosphoenolpyruvate carboxykinase (ATP) [Cesiribacter andamanensis]|uniref:Phosphoenolpyruvate carboxykinase (ATP) n=1 Tax=Cesiribacter andamanensis AMV16 TaxID=1279009 RepID=M7N9R9_9BACT|nr:phosphoenolpyruvate carboxykinase (ATP) [Cesiribacter andamanensis]EMR04017.1 Phosphoenolpyruvate carboxykinase [Cesiribacter andamanensis AMV16]
MRTSNLESIFRGLSALGLSNAKGVVWNLTPAELVAEAIKNGEGQLTDTGALMCDTGTFTGRSPKDRYIIKDALTEDKVWWGDINIAYDEAHFDALYTRIIHSLTYKKLYIRDAYAGADEDYRLRVRIIDTQAWHNLFCYNMFIRPEAEALQDFTPDFTIIAVPEFEADPVKDGTRAKNFAIINFSRRIILVGGTGYTGETKKGIFSVLNFLLPDQRNVLPMHCSANMGQQGDTALFFGLSGTGKTTLSADPDRRLIGDDEHGWTRKGIFNFEGGCYAKVINLEEKHEPQIWGAIKFGAILENTRFIPGTSTVDYTNKQVTENTRVSYPLHYIPGAVIPSKGEHPTHIFFLTCDAYGVLPPISRLTEKQAMYHFISGYTARVAGTEVGITEPVSVFSACFGAPFMPLHPTKYAELLGTRIREHKVSIWLVNTGWTGGAYGTGRRISLQYTRSMISAALRGELDAVAYQTLPVFKLQYPLSCPGVPAELLNPRLRWQDPELYDLTLDKLATLFIKNFGKFEEFASADILMGAPQLPADSLVAV